MTEREGGKIGFPAKFKPLFSPARYKVFYGGRGSGKSWCVARWLLMAAAMKPMRVLCAREFQTSIRESVHKLLSDQIRLLGLYEDYEIQNTRIVGRNGSEFIFKGIRTNTQEIKSLENVDVCWIEEGQAVSHTSLDIIIPTIRKDGSEIVITFNPENDDDPVYERFVVNPPPGAAVVKADYRDNPWFPKELEKERLYCLTRNPDSYDWIWEGECRRISDAQIFKDKYEIAEFETPQDARFFHGADWGYAQDPTVLIRCFIKDECLYVDKELYRVGVDLDKLPEFFLGIETAERHHILADNSRPETIGYMKKQGFYMDAAKKWQGSVADGIAYIRGFAKVYIHMGCVHTAEEFRRYSYRTDKRTGDIIPEPVDANNHCVDAIRYALDGYIRNKGQVDYGLAYQQWFG